MGDSLGVYLSVPFCKAKCSFCNFASDVFAPGRMDGYVERLCGEIRGARGAARRLGARLPERVDTVYFGGGTPSLLAAEHFERMFAAIRGEFAVDGDAEMTLEAAPGQVAEETLAAAMESGVNRVSFGVQSFVDWETAAVGRLHTGAECLAEIARMRSAGVARVSLDLIAGLPHQTGESWGYSVDTAVASGVEHVSVYLMEIDEDSRLGREALAGGTRYGAGALPSDDDTAAWYEMACARLEREGFGQYEISNFAREGCGSRHNLKYWTRQPYLGVGLDAHSMLPADGATGAGGVAVRWANPDDFDRYMSGKDASVLPVYGAVAAVSQRDEAVWLGMDEAFEEEMFLGLRLNAGVDLERLGAEFGRVRMDRAMAALGEAKAAGLVEGTATRMRLTASGRLASNEVFSRLLVG